MCITWHQLFSGWQYLLMKTFSWLPFIPTPSPEVTRGWSKLAFLMQTLWGCDVNLPCRGEFAGLCGTRDSSPILPLPFFSIHITLVHKWKFSKSSQAPKTKIDDPLSFSKKTILEKNLQPAYKLSISYFF